MSNQRNALLLRAARALGVASSLALALGLSANRAWAQNANEVYLDWPMGLCSDGLQVPGYGFTNEFEHGQDNQGPLSDRCDGSGSLYCYHAGIDLRLDNHANTVDYPVFAAADGEVAAIINWGGGGPNGQGYGVLLRHDTPTGTFYTSYTHLVSNDVWVKRGQKVRRGQPLGKVMDHPFVYAHLHYEVRPSQKVTACYNASCSDASLECKGNGYALASTSQADPASFAASWGFADPVDQYYARRPPFPGLVVTDAAGSVFGQASTTSPLLTSPAKDTWYTALAAAANPSNGSSVNGGFYQVPTGAGTGYLLAYKHDASTGASGPITAAEVVRAGRQWTAPTESPLIELRFPEGNLHDDHASTSNAIPAGTVTEAYPYPQLQSGLAVSYCDRVVSFGSAEDDSHLDRALPQAIGFTGGVAVELDVQLNQLLGGTGDRILVAHGAPGQETWKLTASPYSGGITLNLSVLRETGWITLTAAVAGPVCRASPVGSSCLDAAQMPESSEITGPNGVAQSCALIDPSKPCDPTNVPDSSCIEDFGYRQWRRVGAVYRADTDKFELYLDGNRLLETVSLGRPIADLPAPVRIGDGNLGLVDNVKVWGFGRFAPEILGYDGATNQIAWDPAPVATGVPSPSYEALLWTVGQLPTPVQVQGSPINVADLADLPLVNGAHYHFKIRATFADGSTGESDVFDFVYANQYSGGIVTVDTLPETVSPLHDPQALFDGDTDNYAIIDYESAEPVSVIVQYQAPTTLSAFSVVAGGFSWEPEAYTWRVEAADTLAGLSPGGPGYTLALDDTFSYTLATLQLPQPVQARFFKYTATRNDFDRKLHLLEITPVTDALLGGEVTGTVRAKSAGSTAPLDGASVQVCDGAGDCQITATNASGNYHVRGLSAGPYTVRALPPPGTDYRPKGIGPIAVPGSGTVSGQDLTLVLPQPPPPGTEITSVGTTPGGIPIVYWASPLDLQTTGCPGGTGTYQVSRDGATIASGSLSQSGGQYSATIDELQPNHGDADVSIVIVCAGGSQQTVDFAIYIDPSGIVRDLDGSAIEGATVTLYRADLETGPFFQVPDGSGVMSPQNRANPMTTGTEGRFGWDVLAGFYKVVVSKEGCVSPEDPAVPFVQTAVLPVPPPALDLELHLDCGALVPDADGDGFDASSDCDDESPATYPGAPEICDFSDNDCDGAVDEGTCAVSCLTIAQGVNGGVTEDAALLGDYPLWPDYGSACAWTGRSSGGGVNRSLFQFSLAPLLATLGSGEVAHVTSAAFRVYEAWNQQSSQVSVAACNAPWSESSVTFANYPRSNCDALAIGSFWAGDVGERTTDLTGLAQEWLDGTRPNHGVLLEEPAVETHCFYTKGPTLSLEPKLDVCYFVSVP